MFTNRGTFFKTCTDKQVLACALILLMDKRPDNITRTVEKCGEDLVRKTLFGSALQLIEDSDDYETPYIGDLHTFDENGNIDCVNCEDCHGCFKCTNCENCYECSHCSGCDSSTSCNFCTDCPNCKDCTSCKYCRDCTSCNYCENCRNCVDCEDCEKCEDCTDCWETSNCINNYYVDCEWCGECEGCEANTGCDNARVPRNVDEDEDEETSNVNKDFTRTTLVVPSVKQILSMLENFNKFPLVD